MMNGMMAGSSMISMFMMMTFGFLLLIMFIGVTVYVVVNGLLRKSQRIDHPFMILKERYVKGEISDEEYEQKRKILNKQ